MSGSKSKRYFLGGLYTDHTLTVEAECDYPTNRIRVIDSIDEDKFKSWFLIIVVAGVGFMTDAYDLFALNMVIPMLNYVYFDDGLYNHNFEVGLNIATLAGSIIGQLMFGILADRLGRRKMYGLELVITVGGTMGVLMSSQGLGSMSLMGWLLWWRVVVGIGIGSGYPLSAVICAELAPKHLRGRMMAAVFACQPIGQFTATMASLVIVAGYGPRIPALSTIRSCGSGNDPACAQTLDSMWRWIIGIGTLPAIFAILLRFTIPESPRYTLYCTQHHSQAANDAVALYGYDNGTLPVDEVQGRYRPEFFPGKTETEMSNLESEQYLRNSVQMDSDAINSIRANDSAEPRHSSTQFSHTANDVTHHSSCSLKSLSVAESSEFTEDGEIVPDLTIPWVVGFKDYFITQGHYKRLLATSACWFLLDLPFFGLGMNSPRIINLLWLDTLPDSSAVYDVLMNNSTRSLIIVSIGAILGSFLFLVIVERFSRKWIQFYGFILLTVLFIVIGASFKKLLANKLVGAIIPLYILCQIAFNCGPNSTTFIIPAEIFPTRYRTTCHGISAASGKLGSVIAQIFIGYVKFDGKDYTDQQDWLGSVLLVFASFMATGAFITYKWIPETQERNGRSKSLEELGAERKQK